MGLRYELDLPNYANTDTYTPVKDISAEQLAILKELGIPGMDVDADHRPGIQHQLCGADSGPCGPDVCRGI